VGRSLEVRRKSENLPVAGCTFIGDLSKVYRDGNPRVLASWNASVALRPDGNCAVVRFGLNEKTAVTLVGTAVFLLKTKRVVLNWRIKK